jgi:D-alanyl-lipoteichoic acid acyltransferase DltB (MBOAT superfamily)
VIISALFFGYLAAGACVYWLLRGRDIRALFLSALSFGYITLQDFRAAILTLVLTAISYLFAWLIESRPHRAAYHRSGVVVILLVLVVSKYLGALAGTVNEFFAAVHAGSPVHFEHILLPLGISYITFKHISYLTDVYWNLTTRGRFIDFLAYSSLFTIFVAGPIERFETFRPQIERADSGFSITYLEEAFTRIVYGLFKKTVVADWIGYAISHALPGPTGRSTGWEIVALLGYSIQIYMDFSGYSDIAIGSSRLFGFTIMENFNWPYVQPNISEFWKSWHISLSRWIRDYVFFPLSRVGSGKVWTLVLVPVISMVLCGLWHGADAHFLLWGAWHGAGLAVFQMWVRMKKRNRPLAQLAGRRWFNVLSVVATFSFVTLGWVWFR